jgi:metallo-beta-lactamase class B
MKVTAFAILLTVAGTLAAAQDRKPFPADPPHSCDSCAEWNQPREPYRVFGNTYYVGVAGLSAVLVTSPQGHILLDGGLPQSAPLIDASIRKLGFATRDIRLILNSHAHFDHAGGIVAVQRASGAQVAASAAGARALQQGEPTADDPQHGYGRAVMGFPAVKHVRVVADGETLRVGELAVTAHLTPGHTPGSTTWTWRSCEGERCLNMVYADSLNPVSAPGFRFSGDSHSPGIVAKMRRSISVVASLPCDVVITVHPGFANLDEKLDMRKAQPDVNPFIDARACRAYAEDAGQRLDAREAEERGQSRPSSKP